MSRGLRQPASHPLRLLALLLLALGLLVKPVLVAACELDDLALPQSGIEQVIEAADDADDHADDACCPGKVCGECCTAATLLAMVPAATTATPIAAGPHPRAWVQSEPAALPVAIRPPISA